MDVERRPSGDSAARVAGVIQVVLGLGFGIGSAVTMRHLAAHGELPMTPFGFRSMGGPFEQLGSERLAQLGWAFVVVCAADVIAGVWLWQRRRRGLLLGLLTAPPGFALALGFALPFMLIGLPLRVVLALAGRRSLR
jgi:hypothetical protein